MTLTDIDREVNASFQRIFSTPSSDEVLNIYRKFHASPVPRHKEIVCCMLKHLIKEFHLFQFYPNSDLFKMAKFFGGFLEHGLISDKNTLDTFVGYIFYGLKSSNANTFNFSFTALNRFKIQLKHFPKLCVQLQRLNDFERFPQDVIEYIYYGADGLEPPSARPMSSADMNEELTGSQDAMVHDQSPTPEPPAVADAVVQTSEPTAITAADAVSPRPKTPEIGRITTALDDAVLLPTPEPPATTQAPVFTSPSPRPQATIQVPADIRIIEPSKIVKDKIRSILNCISTPNLQIKVGEMKDLIADKHLPWFARYIVTRRVRHEFNFHDLYSSALDCFDSEELHSLILMETLKKVRILLRRNEGIPSMSDKCLIKNLGHWLGVITLARNRPIPQEDIDLEHLLAEAYEKGDEELLFVVQFVAKILESCLVGNFGPENPWTTSMIKCLSEVYEKPNTKLQVKVEIEKVCKALNIKLRHIIL